MAEKTVLVTGGTGFVASHCILQLLNAGDRVRATVRSPERRSLLIEMLNRGGVTSTAQLSFALADLTRDDGWDEAMTDCQYVLHVATPISLDLPADENEMIRPAVEGTLRVLRAAARAEVKRLVLTSSFAAIGYGNDPGRRPFNESDWTNLNHPNLSAYVKSKTLAERAAWDFVNQYGGNLEMSVINPMAIFGPLLGKQLSSGHQLLKQLLEGKMRALPKIDFGIVDVRDVADLHLRAMTHPRAAGERFLALAGGTLSFLEIARTLKQHFGDRASQVPERPIANWLVKIAARFNPRAKQIVPMLGQIRNASNEKAKTLLGWDPRPNEVAIVAAGESILRL